MHDDDMRDVINQAKLATGSTACAADSPSFSPRASLHVCEKTQLVLKDVALPNTIQDVCRDSRLDACVIDFFRGRAARISGAGERETPNLFPICTGGGADQGHLHMSRRDRYAQAQQPESSTVG